MGGWGVGRALGFSPGKSDIPRGKRTFPGSTGECPIPAAFPLRMYRAGSGCKVFESQLVGLCVTIQFPKKHTGECLISVCSRVVVLVLVMVVEMLVVMVMVVVVVVVVVLALRCCCGAGDCVAAAERGREGKQLGTRLFEVYCGMH